MENIHIKENTGIFNTLSNISILDILVLVGDRKSVQGGDFGPMWFLIAIFVAEVVAELIIDISGLFGVAIATVVSAVGLYLTSMIVEPATFLVWFPRCIGATLFFLIGVLISKYIPVNKVTLDNKSRILVPIMAVGGDFCHKSMDVLICTFYCLEIISFI